MKTINLRPEEEQIEFVHYPDTKMLFMIVPAHLATDDFRREVKTAMFVSVGLIHPQEECEYGFCGFSPRVRVTFDDGSEAPYSILSGIGNFHLRGNSEEAHLPTVDSLRVANVVIYDKAVLDAVAGSRMSADAAKKASLVWTGKAETNIKQTRSGGYRGQTFSDTLTATDVPGQSVNGSITESGTPVTFNGTALAPSSFNYNTSASVGAISGSWNGALLDGITTAVTINSNGTVSGSSSGCSFSGTISADSSGKNFYDVSITFGSSPCAFSNQTATGVGVYYLHSDGVTHQLLAGVTLGNSEGTVFFAQR